MLVLCLKLSTSFTKLIYSQLSFLLFYLKSIFRIQAVFYCGKIKYGYTHTNIGLLRVRTRTHAQLPGQQ